MATVIVVLVDRDNTQSKSLSKYALARSAEATREIMCVILIGNKLELDTYILNAPSMLPGNLFPLRNGADFRLSDVGHYNA